MNEIGENVQQITLVKKCDVEMTYTPSGMRKTEVVNRYIVNTDGESSDIPPHLVTFLAKIGDSERVEAVWFLRHEFNLGLKDAFDLLRLIVISQGKTWR